MQNIQNKIDKLIQQANLAFSEENKVIESLIKYTRAYELFNYLEKKYNIQIHEVLVRIAICWDILGNYELAYENLVKALNIVKNVKILTIYKSTLEYSLDNKKSSFETLNIFYKIAEKSKYKYLYFLFNIIFKYINLDRSSYSQASSLYDEIKQYLKNYKICTVILYIRSEIFSIFAEKFKNEKNQKKSLEYIKKNHDDIKKANLIDKMDTECLINEGICESNLTKLFFMILPEMDYYQPKILVNYNTFFNGFKVFYNIIKICKKIKRKNKSIFIQGEKRNKNLDFNYDKNSDTILHYFIRNKYFAPFNISNFILNPVENYKQNENINIDKNNVNDISDISLSCINPATKRADKSLELDSDIITEYIQTNKEGNKVRLTKLKNNYRNYNLAKKYSSGFTTLFDELNKN